MSFPNDLRISTTEMHTGGEPLRIIESGFPELIGNTVLEKRRYARENLDHLRKFVIYEPRGHFDMYGVIIVEADHPEAHFGVLFIHNEGYSTMCGHAVVALGRYAVDKGLVKEVRSPETQVNIQCPCGLVRAFVEYDDVSKKSGRVRFHSVPAFAFALDVMVEVPEYGNITLDIGYGGAFYALVTAQQVALDVNTSKTKDLVDAATAISNAVRSSVQLHHPESEDLAFLYGTILTDGKDVFSPEATANICVFANQEVDRCPTGSGVTARVAVQFRRQLIGLNQTRTFLSGANGSTMLGQPIKETTCGQFEAVVVEVAAKGFYSGSAVFTLEEDDELKAGFLLK